MRGHVVALLISDCCFNKPRLARKDVPVRIRETVVTIQVRKTRIPSTIVQITESQHKRRTNPARRNKMPFKNYIHLINEGKIPLLAMLIHP